MAKHFLPWTMWGLAASFFFIQYIARVAPSVMVPELASVWFPPNQLGTYFISANDV